MEDPRNKFQVVITMHTGDAKRVLSDPERVRDIVGGQLDYHGLEEEVDYTLEIGRVQ